MCIRDSFTDILQKLSVAGYIRYFQIESNAALLGSFQITRPAKFQMCIRDRGYTDVISMHQSGIENVVASSGTALTPGQIRLIHRFTNNMTVLYDGCLLYTSLAGK